MKKGFYDDFIAAFCLYTFGHKGDEWVQNVSTVYKRHEREKGLTEEKSFCKTLCQTMQHSRMNTNTEGGMRVNLTNCDFHAVGNICGPVSV